MKKTTLYILSSMLFSCAVYQARAQVGIGTTNPSNKAILDLVSNNKGLLVPRLSTSQRNAMALVSADNGMIIYNTDLNKLQFWNGGAWADVAGSSADNLGDHSATQNIRLNSNYLSADGNNEGLNITSSGRIRFNTTAATTGIYHFNDHIGVKGTVSLFDTISPADFNYDGGTNGVFIFNNSGVGTGSTKFNTTAVTNALVIANSSGNIGIGTATPNANLQFANTLSNRKMVLYEVANNDHEVVSLGVNGGIFRYQIPATSNEHSFYAGTSPTTSNTLFRIMGNGRVKVPAGSVLDFDNTISNKRLVLFEAAANDHEFNGLGISTGTMRYQAAATTNDHTFFAATSASSSVELMRIKGNGTIQMGSAGQFLVNNAGNILRINNLVTNFPAVQGAAGSMLTNDGAGNLTWAFPPPPNNWSVTGNSGMVDGTNFIGTTTGVPLSFRVNNVKAGRIEIGGNANNFFGYESGANNSTGVNNLALGYRALFQNTAGSNNVALGSLALLSSTSSNNTAIGYQALRDNSSGASNTAVGLNAMRGNLTGNSNVAIGEWSLFSNTDGEFNTVTGANAMRNFTTGSYNTAYGALALRGNAATGNNNSAMGYQALFSNTSGGDNTALGYNTLGNNTTGSGNTAIGANANVSVGNLTNATAIGANASVSISNAMVLGNNTNIGIGTSSPTQKLEVSNGNILLSNSGTAPELRLTEPSASGVNYTAFKAQAQAANITYTLPIANANGVLMNDGAGSLSWGTAATNYWGLSGNAGTNASNFIGTTDNNPLNFRVNNAAAGKIDNTTANTFLGFSSGANATGGNNTAFGANAMASITNGFQNTAVGSNALASNNGSNNVGVGTSALGTNSSGTNNVGIGHNTSASNATGSFNTSVGAQALINNTAGQNTALGYNAGNTNTLGTNNLFLGYNANTSVNNLTNATAIGANSTISVSNTIVLGNNASVGIGTSDPVADLHINDPANSQGGIKITAGTATGTTGADGLSISSNAGSTNIINYEATPLNFGTTGANRMVISATGNVGIGNAAPAQKLDVTGNIIIPAANDYMYASPKTKVYAVAPSAFNSNEPATYQLDGFSTGNSKWINTGTVGQVGTVSAPVNIPDGCLVTGLTAYVLDNDATSGRNVSVDLVRHAHGSTLVSPVASTAATTDAGTSASIQTISAAAPSVTIDNDLYSYSVRFNSYQAATNLRIFTVKLTYTYTKAD